MLQRTPRRLAVPRTILRRQWPRLASGKAEVKPPSRDIRFFLRYARFFISGTAAAGLGIHLFAKYFYACDSTQGISMLPTISAFGDWVLISKYYRRGRGVQVGDIVSFRHPVKEGEWAAKRVIGLSGDFVLMDTPDKSEAMMQVPQGHCWVVGDNLAHSRDSRMFGPLPMALIHGKIIAKWNLHGILPPRLSAAWINNGLQPEYIDYDVD